MSSLGLPALAPVPPVEAAAAATYAHPAAALQHDCVHQRMTPARINTAWMTDLPPVNRNEIAAMSRHAKAGCQTCAAHLNGIARGATWIRTLVARQAKAEAQAAEDERLRAKQPNEYIAGMARRYRTPGLGQAIAVANIERTVMAQASRLLPAPRR
jgi:hypothetical protein